MTRLAAICLIVLTGLFSGCAKNSPSPVMITESCAEPAKPDLPKLGDLRFLESREAYTRIKLRDNAMRSYIASLEEALDCHKKRGGN
ncbi:MAG: hypothetical protein K2H64_03465 [Desulfovibrio sp.]|nr:hypothetical protein [Desulfovibrio sp.]